MANGAFVASTGVQNVDALFGGTKWNALALTYNFPDSFSYYPASYGGAFALDQASFQTATQAVRDTVNWAIQNQFTKVTNLTYTQVDAADPADTSIAGVDLPSFGGYGYFPIVNPVTAGDIARQGDYWYDSPQTVRFATIVRGDNSWRGVIHEIGHTLGLKHGHEGATTTTADRDSMEFSIMTYRKYIGAPPNGDSFADVEKYGAAQTLMMYDIAALQTMYGANYATNSGNTTYTWNPATGEMSIDGVGQGAAGANRIFMTLWDGNGVDTFDLSNYTANLQVDLTPGGWSVFDPAELAKLSIATNTFARGNVFNALLFNNDVRSLIENVNGGSGNDTIMGNAAGNGLRGGGGNDALDGAGGDDSASFSAARSQYAIDTYRAGDGSLKTKVVHVGGNASDGTDTLGNIEVLGFADHAFRLAGAQLNNISDFNGTRFDDVVFRNATTGQVYFAKMVDGAFAGWGAVTGVMSHQWHAIGTGDVNPGTTFLPEVFIQNISDPNGTIYYASLDTGATTFGVVSSSLTSDWKLRAVGDVNGDASVDAVIQHVGTGTVYYANMRDGAFQGWNVVSANLTPNWVAAGAGDLNRDGFADVVVRDANTGTTYYANMAGGVFSGWGVVSTNLTAQWAVQAVGDVTGDAYADVVFQNTSTGTTYYADMAGGVLDHWGVVAASITPNWLAQGLADVDNDGDRDVLFWNTNDGTTYYAAVNGSGPNLPAWGVVTTSITADWQVV